MTRVSRRHAIKLMGAVGAATALESAASGGRPSQQHVPATRQDGSSTAWDPTKIGSPLMRDPVWVYDNWSAYAEGVESFKDTPLTEELAMEQLRQVVRLQQLGVRFDYYMMNAFWFAPEGGYREWRKKDWPQGPDRWLAACKDNGLKPGMWFGTNCMWQINASQEWQDSVAVKHESAEWPHACLSLYEGGFLSHFMRTLQHWYDRGVRMFEFDAAKFDVATAQANATQSAHEIFRRNQAALLDALRDFRRRNVDAMLVAFNDFGGDRKSTAGPFPFQHPVDLRWLEVFDSLYCGDVRVSDVPQANFWRSVDLYNDHMVRRYEQSGVPLERIDPFFTLSTTWFGYNRGKRAWKSMLLSTMARGSWKQTIYGSLGLLSDDEVRWFAKVQRMYEPLLALGRTKSFGGIPGAAQPYGFASFGLDGAIYTVANPSQAAAAIELPRLSAAQKPLEDGRIIFTDAGYDPILTKTRLTLGAGQMAVVGFGRYANASYDLGVEEDVVIPRKIDALDVKFRNVAPNCIQATFTAPRRGGLRLLFQQFSADGAVLRNKNPGSIDMQQRGAKLQAQEVSPHQPGFGGISWAAAELDKKAFVGGERITVSYTLEPDAPPVLQGWVYTVEY